MDFTRLVPFIRDELKQRDPELVRLLEEIWKSAPLTFFGAPTFLSASGLTKAPKPTGMSALLAPHLLWLDADFPNRQG